jgi:hypothetical protein
VAITTLGVEQGAMRPSTAVALVTAGVLSVLIFPTVAIALRRRASEEELAASHEGGEVALEAAGLEPAI